MTEYWLAPTDPRVSRLSEFLRDKRDGSFFVGHAAVLARVNGKLFLVDGVFPKPFFMESWYLFPLPVLTKDLVDQLDGAFISHCHDDHYDLDFLANLKPRTPIYITQGRVGLELIKKDPRFNVVEIPPYQKFSIGNGVDVLAMASDHNDFDSSYIIRGDSFSVYQGNDNFLDEESVRKGRQIMGPVDHAYLPYAYVWWYPFCLTSMDEQKRNAEIKRLNELNMNMGYKMAQLLEAKLMVPSAANLIFCDHANSVINRGMASQFDFTEFVRRQLPPAESKRVQPMMGGDYAYHVEGDAQVFMQGISPEDHFSAMDQFLTTIVKSKKQMPVRSSLKNDELGVIQERAKKAAVYPKGMSIYLFRNDNPSLGVCIDLGSQIVTVVHEQPKADRYISFSIQPEPFELWLSGKMTLEGILNSQRFTVFRKPETFEKPIWDILRTHL